MMKRRLALSALLLCLSLLLPLAATGAVADAPESWPDPEYREMETGPYDTDAGTLRYDVAEDGQTVTIGYEVNGTARSFTVPNERDLLCGALAGTDDLGRALPSAAEAGVRGADGKPKHVGIFYFLWHGEHGDYGVYNLQQIIDTGGEKAKNCNSGLYGPVGAMHWFAEPLYGYYYANDAWVMRKHAELLTNAGIDFLYFDVTNSFPYLSNAKRLMGILHELNEQGYHAPQVVFYTHASAEGTVRQIYNNIYAKNLYPDTWFRIDGKPVIVAPYNANIQNFFHIKLDQWPNEPSKRNSWPWMDFEWPQRVFRDETGRDSCINVSVAQHSGTICFSDSSLYRNDRNRGRSFHISDQSTLLRAFRESRMAFDKDPSLTMQGLNFQAQWDRAIEADVEFVLVTGWNEWVAQRQPPSRGNRVVFIDTASMEFSRDTEMMRGGYFDNYYMQLIDNVRRYKGAAPVVVQDSRRPINVTGGFDQWDDVPVTYPDPKGDVADRDATGFGHVKYVDTSGRNDIVAAKVASDSRNLYFYVETAEDITPFDADSSWMQLFVNTDGAATGFYGYDYLINARAKDAFTTTVSACSSPDHTYAFEPVGEASYRVKGNRMMIAVPLETLGIEGYREIRIEFKWADSDTRVTTMEQFYTDGDAAPLGRLNYVYQNYIPGVSEVVYPERATEAPTEIPTDAPTEAPTDAPTAVPTEAPTEPDAPSGKGCASASASLLPILAAAVLCLRRRRRGDWESAGSGARDKFQKIP